MDLTESRKAEIDGMSYVELLRKWRFSQIGDPWFHGETGEYISRRMSKLKNAPGGNEMHVKASKMIGW